MSDLRGIVLREHEDRLVVRASADEVARFGQGEAVRVRRDTGPWWGQPHAMQARLVRVTDVVDAVMRLRRDAWLFNDRGDPVCRVDHTSVDLDRLPQSETRGFGIDPLRCTHVVRGTFDARSFAHPERDALAIATLTATVTEGT